MNRFDGASATMYGIFKVSAPIDHVGASNTDKVYRADPVEVVG